MYKGGMIWERSGTAYFACVEPTDDRPLCFLIIEPMPTGDWVWEVWRQRAGPGQTANGTARTVHEAMRAAEGAV
jgi:hypothetical protein